MKPVNTNGPSVKQMVSQYAQVKDERPSTGPKPTGNANSATSVVKPGTVANLKKQYAPLDAAAMYKPKGENPPIPEGKQEETKPVEQSSVRAERSNSNPPIPEGKREETKPVDASYMYKDGGAPVTVNPRIPEAKREVESETIRKQYTGEADPKAPVTVNERERSDAPEKFKHNYGPVTYLQGAQLEAKVTAKNRQLPEAIKAQTYASPGQALNELSAAKPGSIAFYRPEKRAENGEQNMSWDVAMKRAAQNPHLASAMMYHEDESKVGLAVKQENGEVKRMEVPREWAQQFKTPGELVDAMAKESGMALDAKRVEDPSQQFAVKY